MSDFKALVATTIDNKTTLDYMKVSELIFEYGMVVIKTLFSSINFKDYLVTIPKGNVARINPIIPGIDCVGEIVNDPSNTYQSGTKVIVSGPKFGVSSHGGYSQFIQVNLTDIYLLPKGLEPYHAALIGTAGFTAMESILALMKHGLKKPDAKILVTGATGGVGSMAIYFLKLLGFTDITALTRQKEHQRWLNMLGVKTTITKDEIIDESNKPLNTQRFDFILDSIGGEVAAKLLPFLSYGGSMSMCGHASGTDFSITVFPMILRGVNILGIDSVGLPYEQKLDIWNKISNLKFDHVFSMIGKEISFDTLKTELEQFNQKPRFGRIVVKF